MTPTLIVLALVAVGTVAVLTWRKRSTPGRQAPQADLASLGLDDARVGDLVSIRGKGDEYEDLDFVVERRNRYESGGDEWFELSVKYRGRRVFVEWAEDDELEITLDPGRPELSLPDLGLTEADLVRMDEGRDDSGTFEHDGSRWRYRSSCEVGYFKDGRGEGEGYYTWSFRDADNARELYVEKWEGEPFLAGVVDVIDPAEVRVYRR